MLGEVHNQRQGHRFEPLHLRAVEIDVGDLEMDGTVWLSRCCSPREWRTSRGAVVYVRRALTEGATDVVEDLAVAALFSAERTFAFA